jgi:hypothetical protein
MARWIGAKRRLYIMLVLGSPQGARPKAEVIADILKAAKLPQAWSAKPTF